MTQYTAHPAACAINLTAAPHGQYPVPRWRINLIIGPEGQRILAGGEPGRLTPGNGIIDVPPGPHGIANSPHIISPQIPFIEFHPGLPQKSQVFLLKRPRLVMGFLILDVELHRFAPVVADRECSVPILPGELP